MFIRGKFNGNYICSSNIHLHSRAWLNNEIKQTTCIISLVTSNSCEGQPESLSVMWRIQLKTNTCSRISVCTHYIYLYSYRSSRIAGNISIIICYIWYKSQILYYVLKHINSMVSDKRMQYYAIILFLTNNCKNQKAEIMDYFLCFFLLFLCYWVLL